MEKRFVAGILLSLFALPANAAVGDYQGVDFYDLTWGASLSGEISSWGEVDAFRFSLTSGGLVAFDVLADERKYSSGGDKIGPLFSNGQWDQSSFQDHNYDGVFSSLDAWLYLFRDDGDLTPDDHVAQSNRRGTGEIPMDRTVDNPFRLGYDEDRNGSNWSQKDPLGFFDLAPDDYLLVIGAADFSLANAVAGSNYSATTCSDYSFGDCAAVGSYRIDIYGTGVIEEVPVVANPIPPALPLFASVVAVLGFITRRQRRR